VLRKRTSFFLLLLWSSVLWADKLNVLTDYYIDGDDLVVSFHDSYKAGQERTYKNNTKDRLIVDFPNTVLAKGVKDIVIKHISLSIPQKNMVRLSIKSPSWYFARGSRGVLRWSEFRIPLPLSVSRVEVNIPKGLVTERKPSVESVIPVQIEEMVEKSSEGMVSKDDTLEESIVKSQSVVKMDQSGKEKISHTPSQVTQVWKESTSEVLHTTPKVKSHIVVIDAGHGGHDPGAIRKGKREKDVVLQIAKKVQKEIESHGHTVYMTRERDRYLSLKERTRIADRKNAAIFISIHANAIEHKQAHVQGVETYFLQNTRDKRSQRIAAIENAEMLEGTSRTTKNVILDLVISGPKIVESNKLAIAVHDRMMKNLRTEHRDVVDGGVRHAPFYVLVGASRPSILVEAGYLSHPKERRRLFTSKYQQGIARGIAQGVDSYLYFRQKELGF
jgi:N-acetylmuramoyl-L-alanine amidase